MGKIPKMVPREVNSAVVVHMRFISFFVVLCIFAFDVSAEVAPQATLPGTSSTSCSLGASKILLRKGKARSGSVLKKYIAELKSARQRYKKQYELAKKRAAGRASNKSLLRARDKQKEKYLSYDKLYKFASDCSKGKLNPDPIAEAPSAGADEPTSGAGDSNVSQPVAPLTCALSANVLNGTVPLTVTFDASGSASTSSYSFDFGDGASKVQGSAYITHTFASAGTFQVKLSTSNATESAACSISIETTDASKDPNIPPLSVPINVKEVAGVGATDYPVVASVPVPRGYYFNTNFFRLVDALGNEVSAQFHPLNYWLADGSIRFVEVRFRSSLSAFTKAGTGISTYYLKDDGPQNPGNSALAVSESATAVNISTGPLQFAIKKTGFNLIDTLSFDSNQNGSFENSEQLISSDSNNGGQLFWDNTSNTELQLDSARQDVVVSVERVGTEMVRILATAPTLYNGTSDHEHGFAVRMEAYNNSPCIKIDYQLENGDNSKKFSWPLYFQWMKLRLAMSLGTNPTVWFSSDGGSPRSIALNSSVGAGAYFAQENYNQLSVYDNLSNAKLDSGLKGDGWFALRGQSVTVSGSSRWWWEKWSNGYRMSALADGRTAVDFELFPEWSAQFDHGQISASGLYWLNDMQAQRKEQFVCFFDNNMPISTIQGIAKTQKLHPVPTLPVSWYQSTAALGDLGGSIPTATPNGKDVRVYSYNKSDYPDRFNMANFYSDTARKKSCITGSESDAARYFVLTEDPQYFWKAQIESMEDMNVRPQYIRGYEEETDYSRKPLTENPYCDGFWTPQGASSKTRLDAPYLSGTGWEWYARDKAHEWLLKVHDYLQFSADPFAMDFEKFMTEMGGIYIDLKDSYPSVQGRSMGHGMRDFTLAAINSGETSAADRIIKFLNQFASTERKPTGNIGGTCEAFHLGYFSIGAITALEEWGDTRPDLWATAFNYIAGTVLDNMNLLHYSYGCTGGSSGSSWTMIDPTAWYYRNTGDHAALVDIQNYQAGVYGSKPYKCTGKSWDGGAWCLIYPLIANGKADETGPSAVGDLQASAIGGGKVRLNWTAPAETNSKFYLVEWATKPISASFTQDTTLSNWFVANPIRPTLTPLPGNGQSLDISTSSGTVYVVLYTFDSDGNMSAVSNMVSVSVN